MAKAWDEQIILSKYHLSVAKRLFENFTNYETKRFLSGCLNELALSATAFVNSFLIYLYTTKKTKIPKNPKQRIEIFSKESNKILKKELTQNTLKIFEIKKAQKKSPVEFLKKDKIILLDNGEYKALTIKKIKELIEKHEKLIREFSKNFTPLHK